MRKRKHRVRLFPTLPAALLKELDALADEDGVDRSAMLEDAIIDYLTKRKRYARMARRAARDLNLDTPAS